MSRKFLFYAAVSTDAVSVGTNVVIYSFAVKNTQSQQARYFRARLRKLCGGLVANCSTREHEDKNRITKAAITTEKSVRASRYYRSARARRAFSLLSFLLRACGACELGRRAGGRLLAASRRSNGFRGLPLFFPLERLRSLFTTVNNSKTAPVRCVAESWP